MGTANELGSTNGKLYIGGCGDTIYLPNDKCSSRWNYWSGTEWKSDTTLTITCSGTLS